MSWQEQHLYKLLVIAKQRRHARFGSTQNKTQQVCQVREKREKLEETNKQTKQISKQTNKQSLLWCLSPDPGFNKQVDFLGTEMFPWDRSVLLHGQVTAQHPNALVVCTAQGG